MKTTTTQAIRHLSGLLGLYALFVILSVVLVPVVSIPAARIPLLWLPIIPVILGAGSVVRMRGATTLQDQLARSALLVATVGMGLGALAVAGRELSGSLALGALWVVPMGAAVWGLGVAIASRRTA